MDEVSDQLISIDVATAFSLARDALCASGGVSQIAECVAKYVVDAELSGHPSHGLRQISSYCDQAGTPGFRLDVEPNFYYKSAGRGVVDAREGLGYRAMEIAVDETARAALSSGIAMCAVIRCGHAGRAGAWVERGLSNGCITFLALGGSEPPFVLAAAPGCEPALHTNPIAIGVPGFRDPMLIDMATSLIAQGKVAVALSRGNKLPDFAILDSDRQPSTDPADFYEGGALLPFGGHKGFGLSAIIEALSVSFTGADQEGNSPQEGALLICIDASSYRSEGDLHKSVEKIRARIHQSGNKQSILAPGDPEVFARKNAEIHIEKIVFEDLITRAGSKF